jgi:hypothetical protein
MNRAPDRRAEVIPIQTLLVSVVGCFTFSLFRSSQRCITLLSAACKEHTSNLQLGRIEFSDCVSTSTRKLCISYQSLYSALSALGFYSNHPFEQFTRPSYQFVFL